MIDPGLVAGLSALAVALVQAWSQRKKDTSTRELEMSRMVDERVRREFEAMDRQIQELKEEIVRLKVELEIAHADAERERRRAAAFEFHITAHGLDIPHTE